MPGKGKRIKSGEKRLIVRIFNDFVGEDSKSKGGKGGQAKTPSSKDHNNHWLKNNYNECIK